MDASQSQTNPHSNKNSIRNWYTTNKSQIFIDLRLACCGSIPWFCFYGFIRASTFIQSTLIKYYKQSSPNADLYIDACFQLLVAGFCFGGILCGRIIPKFGVKKPVMISSIVPSICFLILAATSKSVSIVYPLIFFPIIGIPIGICFTCSTRSIGDHGGAHSAVLMVIAISGNTFGAMILPQVFEYLLKMEDFSVQLLYIVIAAIMGLLVLVGLIIPESKNLNSEKGISKSSENSDIEDISRSSYKSGGIVNTEVLETRETRKNLESGNFLEVPTDKSRRQSDNVLSSFQSLVVANQTMTTEKPQLFSFALLNNWRYMLVVSGHFLVQGSELMFFLKIAPLFETYGFTSKQIADLLTICAFIEVPSKLLLTVTIDRFDKIRQLIIVYTIAVIAFSLIIVAYYLPEENRYFMSYGIVAVSYFVFAYQGSLNFAYINEIMSGTSKYTVALGMHNFLCMGLACTVTPYIGSLLIKFSRERVFESGDDDPRPFLVAYFFGFLLMMGATVLVTMHKIKTRRD